MKMKFVEELTRKILKLLPLKLSDKVIEALVQFVKFGVVGVTNTLLSYVLNVMTLMLLKPYEIAWDYVIGNLVGFFLSVLWSFYWNNKLVFTLEKGQKRHLGKALFKTYISYSFTGIFLCNVLSYVWIDVLGISKLIAPVINLVVSVPINFLINKFWAFRTKESGEETRSEPGREN